jgi:hypothetical protein
MQSIILGSNPCGLTFYRPLNTAAIAKSVRSLGDSTRPFLGKFDLALNFCPAIKNPQSRLYKRSLTFS